MFNTFLTKLSAKHQIDFHYFAKGGFWLTLAQGIIVFGGLLTSVFLANNLSETDYGVYRYLIGVGVLLTSFSLTGIGQSIFQATAKKYIGFITQSLKMSFIYSSGITLMSIAASFYYLFNSNYTLSIGCLLIGILQPVINNFQNIFLYLNGKKLYKESTLLQLIKTLFVTTVIVSTAYFTHNVVILFSAFLLTQVLANFFGYLYYRPIKPDVVPPEIFSKYISYAKNTSVRNVVSNTAYGLDTVLIFQRLGAVELAIYTIANILPEQIKGSFKNITSLLIPKLAEKESLENIKKSISLRSFQLFIILSGITVIYIYLAPYIYALLFPKYENAIFLSQLAALSFPAFVLMIPFNILQIQLKENELHFITIQNTVIFLFLLITLLSLYGLMGAILAKVLSRYVNLLLTFYYYFK